MSHRIDHQKVNKMLQKRSDFFKKFDKRTAKIHQFHASIESSRWLRVNLLSKLNWSQYKSNCKWLWCVFVSYLVVIVVVIGMKEYKNERVYFCHVCNNQALNNNIWKVEKIILLASVQKQQQKRLNEKKNNNIEPTDTRNIKNQQSSAVLSSNDGKVEKLQQKDAMKWFKVVGHFDDNYGGRTESSVRSMHS